jgi:hypothetical protein
MSETNTQIVKKQAKKCFLEYTKENFPMYTIWLKDFFIIHHKIYEFIGDNLENFYKFFDWLNYSKFMTIAYEIMFERCNKSEDDNEIDYYPDPEPSYNLMEERQFIQVCNDIDIEIPDYDDNYYLSFFNKN